MSWQLLVGVVAGLILIWLAMVAALVYAGRKHDDRTTIADALRLLPDLVRLLKRLAADPALPRRVRVLLVLLIGYLLMPIDLVPDFIPVVGYADDAVIVAIALRAVLKSAGPAALDERWPGTPEGLRVIKRLAGVKTA